MLTSFRVLIARLRGLFGGSRRDDELGDEIQAHLRHLESEYVAGGLSPDDAHFAARKAFGGVDQMKSSYRDQERLPFLDSLWQDVRFAVRVLVRDRGFALTAILVLGLGIGVNSMQFAVFDAHLLRGLPIAQPDRVLYISTFDERQPDRGVSYPDLLDLRREVTTLSGLAAYTIGPAVVGDEGRAPERRDGARISANAFDELRIQPVLGRGFLPEEDREGARPVVIIGQALWNARYGSDRQIVGRSIRLDGIPTTVVGVMADRSGFPSVAEVFRPLGQTPGLSGQSRAVRTLRVFGRLNDGAGPAEARAEIEAISERLARDHAETSAGNRARVVPINERFLGRRQPAWYGFLAVGFLVAAISAANVANLLLARSAERSREIAVRTSLGATSMRIVRQLMVESGVLAVLGGALGFAVASAGVAAFDNAVPPGLLPYWFGYEMDLRAFIALMAISLLALLIFGLLPAVHASRTDVNRTLKASAGLGPGGDIRRLTAGFLTAELALAGILLAYLVLSLRIDQALPTDRAVDTTTVLTATVALPAERYSGAAARSVFFQRLEDELARLPGVTVTSISTHLPFGGATERRLDVEGRPFAGLDAPQVWAISTGPRYLETLGLGVLRGRGLEAADGEPGRMNVMINERFAELHFPGDDPIGQRIALTAPDTPDAERQWLTVVGLAPTVHRFADLDAEPIAYLPISAAIPASASLLLRSDMDAMSLGPLVRDAVADLDRELPISRVMTMARVVYETAWSRRVSSVLLSVFALIAVALSGVGLYAVTAHHVGLRTREIGLRMALGATPSRISRMVVRSALVQVGLALGLGLLGTMAWERAFETGRDRSVGLTDPRSLLLVAAVLVVVCVTACLIPARRVTRMSPVTALRQE